MSPQYLTFLALPYIQEHWEHLTLINKLLCIFVRYLSFSPLIHIQIIFRKGKKVSGVWGLGKSNEVRSGTAHLLCSVPQQCIRFVGMWRREKMWRVPSFLSPPSPQNLPGPQQAPTPFLPPPQKALWFYSQTPGMNLWTVLCPLSIIFGRESCCPEAVCFPGVPVGGTQLGLVPWWHLQPCTAAPCDGTDTSDIHSRCRVLGQFWAKKNDLQRSF